ncbi:MAG TPA: hypothetical protein PLG60_09725 [Acidimicrobiales bacterium]|nr:hypothetical protein [Acidimicrobiales bacterium]
MSTNTSMNNARRTKANSCAPLTFSKQRVLFFLGGTFVLVGTVLSLTVSRWFAAVPLLVGANQWLMSAVGWCPMSKLLDRFIA